MRIANKDDMLEIQTMYEAALYEMGEDYENIFVKTLVRHNIDKAPCFILGGKGFAGFYKGVQPINGKPYMADYMFYLKKEHRSIENLGLLVNAAKKFATDNNLILKVELNMPGSLKMKERLLRMYEFKPKAITGVYNG